MDSELDEIKASILEIRDSLSEPLKGPLNEKINETEAYFEDNEPGLEIKKVFFTNCLKYAKEYAEKCKKIEKDFPPQWPDRLTSDSKLLNTFLCKLSSICVLADPASEIDKGKNKIYSYVIDILENLLSSHFYQTYNKIQIRNAIKKNILELLIIFLSKQEHVKFDDEYGAFFTDISCLIRRDSIRLNNYLDKIDNIEKSNYFSQKMLIYIRKKIFEIIFSIDPSIIYGNLLAKIKEIANSEFSDHPGALTFINCFIFELTNKENYFNNNLNQNERLDLGLVLLYQALNRKRAQAISPSNISFAKRLITLPPKSTFGGKLFNFKQDYRDKTGKEFPWEVLNTGQVSPGEQVGRLPEEMGAYFSTREINRSPLAVKEAFNIALQNYAKLALPEAHQAQTASIKKVNKFKAMGGKWFKMAKEGMEKVVEKVTEKTQTVFDKASNKVETLKERGQDILEKGHEMKEIAIDALKDTVSNLKWSAPVPEEPLPKLSLADEKRLSFLRGKLEDMASQLYQIESFLKNSIDQDRLSSRIISDNAETTYLNNEEFPHLETQSEEIGKALNAIYVSAIDKLKPEIENNSWFKNEKFSLKERIKFFFTRGSYSVNLEKLKNLNGLNDKIDFKAEKDFFLKVNFSSLFHCGIIRWPWLNKENFAMKWAKQVILLKIKEGIETTNENLSKASLLLEILKIYHEIFSSSDKKDFFSELYPDINQANIKYSSELGRLLRRINTRIGVGAEVDSPVATEINLDSVTNNTVFFNAGNKEQGPPCSFQSSLYRMPSNPSI